MDALLKELCEITTDDVTILKLQVKAQKLLLEKTVPNKEAVEKEVEKVDRRSRAAAIREEFKGGAKVCDIARKYQMNYQAVYQLTHPVVRKPSASS